ncbi:MAG: HYR domain-containing protein, partial [Bacteroidales bacterium]|nr:HYR domain-containing protein [Bacteroidales bacterium]
MDSVWNDYTLTGDASGSYYVGLTDVWWYAVDIYGNTDSCMMTVTVIDTVPPMIICPDDIVQLAGQDSCSAFVVVPQPAVYDNCEIDSVWNDYNFSSNATDVYDVGITEVWWFVSDIYGLTNSCMMTITVLDEQPPVVTCPDDVQGYADYTGCEGYVEVPPATATDNCEVDSIWNSYNLTGNASDTYEVGATDVWWFAVDIYGNSDSCMMIVTIDDTIAPVITCPPDTIVYAMADSCWADVVLPPAMAIDNCEVDSVWNDYTMTGDASGSYYVGLTEIWWYAVDIYGNTDSCMMSVEVIDTIPPQITCPDDFVTVAGVDSCSAYVSVPLPIATDNCEIDSVWNDYNFSSNASDVYDVGVTDIWWYVVDIYANIDSCMMTVTVNDDQPPVVICPDDITGYANETACEGYIDIPLAITTDNCEVDSVWNSYNLTTNASDTYEVGATDVWWFAVDIYGNIDSCMMIVTIDDTIPPVITCPADTIVYAMIDSCWAYVVLPPATATDNCEVDSVWNGYNLSGDASDLYEVGATDVWWYAVDIYGNTDSCFMIVSVVDSVPPIITCPDDIIWYAGPDSCEAFVPVPQPDVIDNCGALEAINDYNGTTDASDVYVVGTTDVWWFVADIYGNADSCMMTITVIDTIPPQIACPDDIGQNTDSTSCSAYVTVPVPVASDNCQLESLVNDYTGTDDASATYYIGTTEVTWIAIDIYGNVDSCFTIITVADSIPPQITCPDDIMVITDPDSCYADVIVPLATASDNCEVDSIWNDYTMTANASSIYPAGSTIVNWFAVDIYGNIDSCFMVVTVVDSIPPIIICPDDIVWYTGPDSCEAFVPVPPREVIDNCGAVEAINDYNGTTDASDIYVVGTTDVWWFVADIFGNADSCMMTITVIDTIPPQIACPDDIGQNTDSTSCSAYVTVPIPVASDNCQLESLVNDYTGTDDASATYYIGTTVVSWIATDIYGNVDSCFTTITIADSIPPQIVCPDDIMVITDPDSCYADVIVPLATATDNCAVDSVWNDYTMTNNATATYPAGVTIVNWYAVDIYGNWDSCFMTVTVVDSIPPEITCPDDIVWYVAPDSCEAFVPVPQPLVIDNCGVLDAINDYNGTTDTSDIYPVGITTVIWTVPDFVGNEASCSMTITVIDTIPPEITCPDDIIQSTDSTSCSAMVYVPLPDTSDNCEVDSVYNDYTGTNDASAVYNIGTTQVNWVVVDIYGNSDSCFMSITIVDSIPPVIICPDDIVEITLPDTCSAYIEVPLPDTTDNCAVDSAWNDYTMTGNASAIYQAGVTVVWWYAVDIYGNIDSCFMTITVLDSIPPTIICPDDIVWYVGPDSCEAFVPVPQPIVDDNCGAMDAINDYNGTTDASDIYPVGITYVTWTVPDLVGNQASCTMTITVIDTIPPVLPCPDDINHPTDSTTCSAFVTVPLPDAYDNCELDTLFNDYTGTGDASAVYNIGSTTVNWFAEDIYGNASTCSMVITIYDSIPPHIICPDDIVQITLPDSCAAYVIVPLPVTWDNCGVDHYWNDFTNSNDASGMYQAGVTVVNWFVVDIFGNMDSCSMTVAVVDSIPPEIFCPEDIIWYVGPDSCEAFVPVPKPVVNDNCGA